MTPAAARRPWILMRLIGAGNCPAAGRPARVTSPDGDQTVPGRPRRRLPSATAARALAVQWELSLPWELKSVSRTRSTPLIRAVRKTADNLEPRYGIEP